MAVDRGDEAPTVSLHPGCLAHRLTYNWFLESFFSRLLSAGEGARTTPFARKYFDVS
jgi:hypothetical protein